MKIKNILIAHRGIYNNKNIPENSILSFRKAILYNIPIEMDVQITKDSKLVIFHDENIKRMTGVDKDINDLTLNDISKYYLLDTKEKIPTLEEALKTVSSRVLIVLELKYSKDYKKLVDNAINQLKQYTGPIIIQTFSLKIIRYLYKKKVKYKYGLLVNKDFPLITLKLLIKAYSIYFISISKYISSNKYIEIINNPVIIWTIKNKKDLEKYEKNGYSYICNNLPFN